MGETANRNSISDRTKVSIPLSLFIALVISVMGVAVAWGVTWSRGGGALTREEAYRSFVDQAGYDNDQAYLQRQLETMNAKLDKLLMDRGGD